MCIVNKYHELNKRCFGYYISGTILAKQTRINNHSNDRIFDMKCQSSKSFVYFFLSILICIQIFKYLKNANCRSSLDKYNEKYSYIALKICGLEQSPVFSSYLSIQSIRIGRLLLRLEKWKFKHGIIVNLF